MVKNGCLELAILPTLALGLRDYSRGQTGLCVILRFYYNLSEDFKIPLPTLLGMHWCKVARFPLFMLKPRTPLA